MSLYDINLAASLDRMAEAFNGDSAVLMITAASRIRQLAALPDHLLPPPPIVPTRLPAGPKLEHILETVGDDAGFHDVGKLSPNAKLRRPPGSDQPALPPRKIFEDPRLKPDYKPKK
jgi:hypothetical protein